MAKINTSVEPPTFPRTSAVLLVVLLLSACNPGKRLQEGEVFLASQQIKIDKEYEGPDVDVDDLTSILKQRTNRKILFVRFHLWAYNSVNPEKQELSREKKSLAKKEKVSRKQERLERLVAKEAKQKKIQRKSRKLNQFRKEPVTVWRDWFTETVGEKPVALDSTKATKSADQIEIYLSKHGHFNNEVDYVVDFKRKGKMASVTYEVSPKTPYLIREVEYQVDDPGIKRRLDFLEEGSLMNRGEPFDVEVMDKERDRITSYLNDRGYFAFTKDFISYEADSTVGAKQVDVIMSIRNLTEVVSTPESPDSLVIIPHYRYFIGNINIYTDFEPTNLSYSPTDTLVVENVNILYSGELMVDPSLLVFTVLFDPGDLYQKGKVERTYRRFNRLGIFGSVNIRFQEQYGSEVKTLDCDIFLEQSKRQFFATETTGTHTEGNLGVQANINYTHRNVFGGAESGNFRITTGFEAQQTLTQTNNSEQITDDVTQKLNFNTFEIGPELSLNFKRIFPLKLDGFSRNSEPSSSLTGALNYQARPDYVRTLTKFRYQGRFVENRELGRSYYFHLPELSLIKINKSQAFEDYLESINDDFLTSSYQDHLISSFGLGLIFDNKKRAKQAKYYYLNSSVELAGWGLRNVMEVFGPPGEDGVYRVAGIRFAEFVKWDADFRFYRNFDEKNTWVFRVSTGVGVPFENLNVLPFERSFIAGGANGNRAWQARSLGPGSFRDSTALVTFNHIGEIKIESNAEYRFDLTPTFEGALFVDIGNIWMIDEDPKRPGSGFSNQFLSEMAVGTGIGARLDFDFFLVRFDFGIQLKDPAKIPGERWIWEPKDEYNQFLEKFYPDGSSPGYSPVVNFNLGIGYPF